jgi:hypothetical protein
MVGTMAIRGESRAAILAEYPHLHDDDIELARGLAAAGYTLMSGTTPSVDAARFRHRDADKPIVISEFDRWVGDNNIPETYEYSKGWWDYVELVRRFASRFKTDDVRVIGHYVIDTPPPCERLPMPAVAISIPGLTVALRFDFGGVCSADRDHRHWRALWISNNAAAYSECEYRSRCAEIEQNFDADRNAIGCRKGGTRCSRH